LSTGRNTIYNLGGALVPFAFTIFTVPAYIHLIGTDRFGVLSIAWVLLGYFGLFDLGFGRACTYRIASLHNADAQSRADVFWAALAVNLAMGVAGAGILWLGSFMFYEHAFKTTVAMRREIVGALPMLAACLPVTMLNGILTGSLQGRSRFLETNIVNGVSLALFQVVPLGIAYWIGHNLNWLLAGVLGSRIVGALLAAPFCQRHLTAGTRIRIRQEEVSLLFRFGGWVTVTSLITPLLISVDRFAIGARLGATPVTVYSVPFQLTSRIAVLPASIGSALFPRFSSAGEAERRETTASATTVLAVLLTPCVVLGIFGLHAFLKVWIGPSLADPSAAVGRVVLVGWWLNAFALLSYTALQASGRPDLVTKILLLEIPPYLLCLFLGLKYFAMMGAAGAFVFRCLLDYTLLSRAARDTKGTGLIAANLAILGLSLLVVQFLTDWTWAWALCTIGVTCGAVVLGWFGLAPEMRGAVLRRMQRALVLAPRH
jgi:O-antigen/teichoic acid export membrane protein